MKPPTLRTDDLTWREIDDEIVALEGFRSMYLAAALAAAQGIDPAAAGADTGRSLEQMRAAGLLAA